MIHQIKTGATVEAATAPVMVTLYCPFCTAPLEADGTCWICNRMAKIAEMAAARRKAWCLYRRGEGPRPA